VHLLATKKKLKIFAHCQQILSRPNVRNSKFIKIHNMWLKRRHFDIQCQYNFVPTQYSAFLHRPSKLQVSSFVVLESIVKIKRCFLFPTGPLIRTKFRMWAQTHYLSPKNIIQSNLLIHKYCFIIKILHYCFKSVHNNLDN
jgi:hypothetical protein